MTPRPGRVSTELAIDAPDPRDAQLPHLGGIRRAIAASPRRRWRRRCACRERRHERAHAAHLLRSAPSRAGARRPGVGPGRAPQRHPALRPAVARAWCCRRWSPTGRSCGRRCWRRSPPRRGAGAGGGRRRRPRGAVQPVAADRALALSLCGDPAGDAGGGDRAAAADLSAAAGGGAGLRLDRRVLPGAGQHHARAELGRPQPRRPVPALRRVALAGAVGAEAAGGAAADARRHARSPAACR